MNSIERHARDQVRRHPYGGPSAVLPVNSSRPIFTSCRRGQLKYEYLVFANAAAWHADADPIERGFVALYLELCDIWQRHEAWWVADSFVRDFYWRRVLKEKASRQPAVTDPVQVELLWFHQWWIKDHAWEQHMVVKKTKKYVFVDRMPYPKRLKKAYSVRIRCHTISRESLERDGYAPFGHGEISLAYFFTDEGRRQAEMRRTEGRPASFAMLGIVPGVPDSFAALGLEPAATVAEVKRAWRRKARKLHPDAGGESQSFLELRKHYERALAQAQP